MSAIEGLPLTTLGATLGWTLTFVITWTCLKAYVDKRGALRWVDQPYDLHNSTAAILGLVLGVLVLDIGHDVIRTHYHYYVDPSFLGYLYHIFKVYQYLDIVLAVLTGETTISRYSAFTHLALPIWSYFRIIARPGDAYDWRLQVIVDCFARFATFLVPRLTESLATERALEAMCEEGRWYADIAIFAFWSWYVYQGQRTSKDAIRVFGVPYTDEIAHRMVGLVIVLYASYLRRQEDSQRKTTESTQGPITSASMNSPTTQTPPSQAHSTRQRRR